MKKTLALILALASLAMTMAACSNDTSNDDSVNTTDTTASDTTVAETEDTIVKDNLPEVDMDGMEFRILNGPSTSWNTIMVSEQTGDIIEDAVYKRNSNVEERFNMKIVELTQDSSETLSGIATNNALSGDDIYDMAVITDRDALVFAQQGLALTFDNLPYIDTSREYWSQSINEDISINNNLYFSYGDFNLTAYDYTFATFFNKRIAESLGVSDLYTEVENGKWTYDMFEEYAKLAVSDLNGDGAMDATDAWGLAMQDKHVLPSFWIAAGVKSITKDADDVPVFTAIGDEKFATVIDKIFTMVKDNGLQHNDAIFKDCNSLFTVGTIKGIIDNRDMQDDFGVIPLPKYDESQDVYYSRVGGGALSVVPVTVKNAENISIIIEAMACESKNVLIPAYYEDSLKSKYSRDVQSEKMLDLIFENRVYDLGDTYWTKLLRDGVFRLMYTNNDRDFTSNMAEIEGQINATISEMLKSFEAIK